MKTAAYLVVLGAGFSLGLVMRPTPKPAEIPETITVFPRNMNGEQVNFSVVGWRAYGSGSVSGTGPDRSDTVSVLVTTRGQSVLLACERTSTK